MTKLALTPTECQIRPGWETAGVDLDAFRWLLTEPGQRLLEAAGEATGQGSELSAQSALRRTASPEQVAAALTQVELRRQAETKFGDLAGRMYFTPDGLEQATRLPVASHRAARVRAASADHPGRPRLRHRR